MVKELFDSILNSQGAFDRSTRFIPAPDYTAT